ncbi:MAG: hypothetical protein ACRDKZ_13395 [Actinomycetota bacterium]
MSTWATLKAFVYETAATHATVVTQEERNLLTNEQRTSERAVFLAALDVGDHFIAQGNVVDEAGP